MDFLEDLFEGLERKKHKQRGDDYKRHGMPAEPVGHDNLSVEAGGTCHQCSNRLQPSFKFCPECGAKVPQPRFCTHCGTKLAETGAFCPGCGEKV
ncbi:double zinc ribbon protein [Hydrogenispora ethanolica]|uniref:Double zinc ribbon protein n=1 Tax=Hydrogenispora ethanolica TaxID=1082276 RepID=A0A4R1R9E7_HYDET|nr:zinc ribbon domain-containing protein [Hydrogenispora ethanolica]TCL62190.1 double zinc ribbon protein [Hydrogenispora ethanolica]